MNLEAYIKERLQTRKILLMTHVIVGYPSLEVNWRMLEIMAEVGVDLVELQMPFSEPVADGPTFARANQLAIERGIQLHEYFDFMHRCTAAFDFPHLMMGYYNTVFRLGSQVFCQRVKESGGTGFILPDLPIEEYGDLFEESRDGGLSPILLMAPTNTSQRLEAISRCATGFVYTIARKGVTGKKTEFEVDLYAFLERCRRATDLPLGLGFGLRQGEDLHRLQERVEIGIVGSALLDAWEQKGEKGYRALLQDLAGNCN